MPRDCLSSFREEAEVHIILAWIVDIYPHIDLILAHVGCGVKPDRTAAKYVDLLIPRALPLRRDAIGMPATHARVVIHIHFLHTNLQRHAVGRQPGAYPASAHDINQKASGNRGEDRSQDSKGCALTPLQSEGSSFLK